jgi:hypothetical protein
MRISPEEAAQAAVSKDGDKLYKNASTAAKPAAPLPARRRAVTADTPPNA